MALEVKNPLASAGDSRDVDLFPGWEDPLEEGGNPLQYSCLENPTDRGVWRVPSVGLQKSYMTEATLACSTFLFGTKCTVLLHYFEGAELSIRGE